MWNESDVDPKHVLGLPPDEDEPTLEDFINMLDDPDPNVRRNAAWLLGRYRDVRVLEPLITALGDEDASVRVRAAESLSKVRQERTVDALIDAFNIGDDDEKVRAMIVTALSRQGDFRAVDMLIECLMKDPSERVRIAAAEAISELPDKRAIPALVEMLLHDKGETSHYAARSLGIVGGKATVDALLEALKQDPDSVAKIYIAETLAGLFDKRAIPPLQALTNDPDESVSESAKWAVKQLGG